MKYSSLKDLLISNRGNFAAMTALVSVPVLAGAIMMVEYSNLSDNHARLQNAVDAAALYVGKHAMETGDLPNDLDVERFLAENFDGHIGSVSINGDGSDDTNYSVEATSIAPRYFLGSAKLAAYNQKAKAFVPKFDLSNVAVALVLDNTTSMDDDDKIETLRDEATAFVNEIENDASDPSAVRVALVPFHRLVNVGWEHHDAPWINIKSNQLQSWNGCVGLRRFDYTYEHEYKNSGGNRARFRALNGQCTEPITPLTNDWDLLRRNINELRTVRGTFVAVGAMWGLSVLSPSVPFTEVTELDDPARVMIIMADGDNSRSLSPAHKSQTNEGDDEDDGDDQTELACDAAKDEGVTIYTIAFGDDISPGGKRLLQNCASQIANYFIAEDAAGLRNAFKKIGRKITRLRLTG